VCYIRHIFWFSLIPIIEKVVIALLYFWTLPEFIQLLFISWRLNCLLIDQCLNLQIPLLTGKVSKIIEAVKFLPEGVQKGLR
jgi:hypothetical protein